MPTLCGNSTIIQKKMAVPGPQEVARYKVNRRDALAVMSEASPSSHSYLSSSSSPVHSKGDNPENEGPEFGLYLYEKK